MSVNLQVLVGRLGNDPETRFTKSGGAVTNFSMATNSFYTKNGEKQEDTQWHKIIAFGKLAEICRDYLAKGRQVYISGETRHRQWEDRDGNKRTSTEVIANVVRFMGNKEAVSQAPSDDSEPPAHDNTPSIGDEDVSF